MLSPTYSVNFDKAKQSASFLFASQATCFLLLFFFVDALLDVFRVECLLRAFKGASDVRTAVAAPARDVARPAARTGWRWCDDEDDEDDEEEEDSGDEDEDGGDVLVIFMIISIVIDCGMKRMKESGRMVFEWRVKSGVVMSLCCVRRRVNGWTARKEKRRKLLFFGEDVGAPSWLSSWM